MKIRKDVLEDIAAAIALVTLFVSLWTLMIMLSPEAQAEGDANDYTVTIEDHRNDRVCYYWLEEQTSLYGVGDGSRKWVCEKSAVLTVSF